MKLFIAIAATALILFAACEPSGPTGTLPVVQNLTVVTGSCHGDTVVLSWDALDVTVDCYHIYFCTAAGWISYDEFVTEETTYSHVASSTGFYRVSASEGANYSSGYSNQVHTTTNRISGPFRLYLDGDNGFILGQGSGTEGDATSDSFAQHVYIAEDGGHIYMYNGAFDGGTYPNGEETPLCLQGTYGNAAPEPSSDDWVDSVLVEGSFTFLFAKLENGHYAHMSIDTVYTDGIRISMYEYQTIEGLRLFDVW